MPPRRGIKTSVSDSQSSTQSEDFDFDFDLKFSSFPLEENAGSTLIELLTGSNLLEISNEIRKGWIEVKEQTNEIREKFRHQRKKYIYDRIASIESKMNSQKGKRLQDKFTFVLGVTFIWLTCFFMVRFPDLFPLYYLLTFLPMISIRWFTYRSKKWHYFLADLCYFVNVLLTVILFFYHSQALFVAVFFLSHGPVAWAIYAWRNALVFHSLDKMTSIAIHILPALVMYTLRWLVLASPATISSLPTYPHFSVHPDPALDQSQDIFFFSALGISSAVYIIWQVLYCYFILILKADKVFDNSHATSYTWLLADYMKKKKSNPLTRLFLAFPDSFHPYLFFITQYLYALLTMAPCIFYYKSFFFHTMFILFIVFLSIFNGADYYIEVFSLRYRVELERLEKQASGLSPLIPATSGSNAKQVRSLSPIQMNSGSRNSSVSSFEDFGDECPLELKPKNE